MQAELVSEEFADSLVSTCRAALGDLLRSVVYFTPEEYELLYLRSDLYGGDEERARAVKAEFVENERMGFTSDETYGKLADEDAEPGVGDYQFTVRGFSRGFVNRVIVGDRGVLLTTDDLDIGEFEELAVTIRKMLADASD